MKKKNTALAMVLIFSIALAAAAQQYIESLKIGGGYGTTGIDLDADGAMQLDGTLTLKGDVLFVEKADHSSTPSAGNGYLWVRSDTPNVLVFTDDAGTDTVLGAGGGGGDVSDGDTLSTGLTFPNTGLHLLDTNASHDLIISPGTDLSADRTLTITTGDSNRTLTMSANASIGGTNTGDVTLAGARDYLVIASQEITLGPIDLSGGTDVTGDLPLANIAQIAQSTLLGRAAGAGTGDVTALAHLAIQTLLNTASGVTSTSNSVAWNSDNARIFTHTLTENTTIAASSGTPFDGQLVLFAITQAAGSYTLAWNAQFAAGEDYSDTIPAMSTTNGNLDFYLYFYSSGKTKFVLLDQMAY